jgi:hypothetical protein
MKEWRKEGRGGKGESGEVEERRKEERKEGRKEGRKRRKEEEEGRGGRKEGPFSLSDAEFFTSYDLRSCKGQWLVVGILVVIEKKR